MIRQKYCLWIAATTIVFFWGCQQDRIILRNNLGNDNAIVLLDARRSAGCVNDETLRGSGSIGAGSVLSNAGCNSEVVVFSDDNSMALITPVNSWTDTDDDELPVNLTPLLQVPVTFWIMNGAFTNTQARAVTDLIRANALYNSMNTGINFVTVTIENATGNTNTAGLLNANCGQAASLQTQIGFTQNSLNVYYLNNPGARGWWCGNNTIIIGATADNESLAHEFGHAFTLGHTNIIAGIPNTNLMVTGGAGRNSITEGQGFRMNINIGSVLNNNSLINWRLLNWSFAGNTTGFGHGHITRQPTWTGNFSRADRYEILFYNPGDDNWWLGSHDGTQFQWSLAGNTAGFGHGINDGRPFWIGDFNGDNRSDVLFYYPGDDNWWLGTHQGPGGQIIWSIAGNTAGFGHGINDGRPFWIGRFSRADRDEVLFYYPGDDNWWLGSHDGTQFQWSLAGNTAGFGHGINDGRPFWIGDFNGDNRSDVLFYYPGDDNWWLGTHQGPGGQFGWGSAGNTANFGHGHITRQPNWIGNFSRADRDEVLFYYPGDDNWWLGSHDGTQFQWSLAGNTAGFGHGINDGRPFWIGDFNGDNRSDVLFYYPGDDNWWLGTHQGPGGQFGWGSAGNTANFGHGHITRQPNWIGNFSRADRDEVLFYYPGDDNWWLGSHNAINAVRVGTTRNCPDGTTNNTCPDLALDVTPE